MQQLRKEHSAPTRLSAGVRPEAAVPSTVDNSELSNSEFNNSKANFWSRECGLRDLLRIGLPLIISTTSFTALHFCDRLFLSWHTTVEMGAVMNGGAVTWSSVALPMGTAMYTATFVAQFLGAGQRNQIGAILWAGLRIGMYTAPLFLLFGLLAPYLFRLFDHETALQDLETLYVQILCVGSPAAILGTALSALYIGQGHTRVVMLIDILMALINIVLDYVMIFGYWGFPEGGLEGAAWATVIAMWCKPAMLLGVLYLDPDRPTYRLHEGARLDLGLLRRVLGYGIPNGLQFLQEASSFTLFLMFVGRLGTLATEATTMAININLIAFVPIIGLGTAVTTMVGQQIGRGRPDLAERATWNGLTLGMVYAGLFAIVYTVFPSTFMSIYQLDPQADQQLYNTALVLLRFVATYCIFDAIQLVFVSAIKGAGDTWFAMFVSIGFTAVFIAMGLLGAQAFESTRAQLLWWWSSLTTWIVLLAIGFFVRFQLGYWKQMSVVHQSS